VSPWDHARWGSYGTGVVTPDLKERKVEHAPVASCGSVHVPLVQPKCAVPLASGGADETLTLSHNPGVTPELNSFCYQAENLSLRICRLCMDVR
jgi:hypothetical protein